MKKINLEQVFDVEALIAEVIEVLKAGGAVVCPSNSGFVILVLAENIDKIEKLRVELNVQDTVPFLIADKMKIFDLASLDDVAREIIEEYLPGNLILELDGVGIYESRLLRFYNPSHNLLNLIASKVGELCLMFEVKLKNNGQCFSLLELESDYDLNLFDLILDPKMVLDFKDLPAIVRVDDNQLVPVRTGALLPKLALQFSLKSLD